MEIKKILVLVPHPELRGKMHRYCAELFGAGLPGAWAFPPVAPLALLSQAVEPGELKRCAALLRSHNRGKGDYKIRGGAPECAAFPLHGLSVFGPRLGIAIPEAMVSAIGDKAQHWFSPVVLAAAITGATDAISEAVYAVNPPELIFRAAALAIMSYTPLPCPAPHSGSEFSYSWKIGRLFWLPHH